MDKELLQQGLLGTVSSGNYAYVQIPAYKIRNLIDSAFPAFAKNATADVVSGYGHRWVAGHDLLLDVPKTFIRAGPIEGLKHLGHILFTDFPTKAGIPIPLFSKSGLGEFLVNQCHIPQGYLSINVVDGVVGIFACTEGFCDLLTVCSAATRMTPQLFFDTFVQGCAEVTLGASTQNPLLWLAGGEQVLAGIVSSAYTITHPDWYVAPSVFLGGSLTSGILGFLISKFVFHRTTEQSLRNAARGCAVAGLFAIETGFGMAALCGFVGMGLGRFLADRDNRHLIRCCKVSKSDLEVIVDAYATCFPKLISREREENTVRDSFKSNADNWGLEIATGMNPSFGIEFSIVEHLHNCSQDRKTVFDRLLF